MEGKHSETTGETMGETTGQTLEKTPVKTTKYWSGDMPGTSKFYAGKTTKPQRSPVQEALDPVRNELMKKRYLRLTNDTFVKYFFTLEILGKDAMRKRSLVGGELGIEKSIDISTSSSHLAAVGLFTLQNLQNLSIWHVDLDDDFYKGMCAAASQSKIERFSILGMDPLGPDASLHCARGLFSMPNLKSLQLYRRNLSDEFYSAMATEASHSKIEKFTHNSYSVTPLGPDASLHYARGLFSMPNLKSLQLIGRNLSDEFYSTMATEALHSKIERFSHSTYGGAALGPDASLHYARGLFSMPNLKSLQLFDPQLSDEFYSTMATGASNSKIQSLDMEKVSMTQRILHAILSLKHLQSLKMREMDFVDKHDEEMLTHKTSTVDELSLDGRDVTSLWKLGLHTSCPQLQKLCLHWQHKENVSSDIVTKACSPFNHLTHLDISGDGGTIDPESFSSAIITSCPHLSWLYISCVGLHSDKATKIIQSMKTHQHLTSLKLFLCKTDERLDPLIAEVNSEGKLTVTVTHNPRKVQQRKEMPSFTKKSTPTRQESSSVSGEGNIAPIEMECHKTVGVEGGKLQLDSFGIELDIPPGAIDSETPQDISLCVLTDTPDLGNSEEEMSVCFGVQCLAPNWMVLKSPVTFTIHHCAIISRVYNVKAILYCGEGEYTPGAVVKERIQLPLSGIPSCVIMEDVLKFRVNHFTWWFFTFSKNDSLQGKRLCCLPMVCTKMPVERTPIILHTHLYDDIKGNSEYGIIRWIKSIFAPEETWLEEELNESFKKVHSETQILVQPSGKDLKLTCSVNKERGEEKTLGYSKVCSLRHNCVPFQLDLRGHPDNVAVLLKVGQDDETELLCPVLFTPYMGIKSSSKESKVAEAKVAEQNDFDDILKSVAKCVRKNEEIDDLGKALGFEPDEISSYVASNVLGQDVSYMGTLSMLRKWRKHQTKDTESEALKSALVKARQIHLAHKLLGT